MERRLKLKGNTAKDKEFESAGLNFLLDYKVN